MIFLRIIKIAFLNLVYKLDGSGREISFGRNEYGQLISITSMPIISRATRGSTRGGVSDINNSLGTGTITVPSTTVVYSRSFNLKYGTAFGIWYQAGNGSGQANMKIELEQGYKVPTTEGSADSSWVIGEGVAPINSNLNDGATQLAHIKTVSPVPMKHGRLKITGLGSNPADATLVAKLFQQELVA